MHPDDSVDTEGLDGKPNVASIFIQTSNKIFYA